VTIFMDWSYSWVEMSGVKIATERNIWILVPHLLSLLVLIILVGSRMKRTWLAFMVAVIQTPIVFLSTLKVEMSMDMSLLTPAALFCMGGGTVAATLLIPTVVRTLPVEGSRLWRVVFSGRQGLIDGVKGLSERMGLTYAPPRTIFESGSAEGKINGIHWEVNTPISLWPPGYGLVLTLTGPKVKAIDKTSISTGIAGRLPNTAPLETSDNRVQFFYVFRHPENIDKAAILALGELIGKNLDPPGPISD